MAFGDEIVDNLGRVRFYPGASNLTGLLANALGWTRAMREAHARLQERLAFAVRLDRPGHRIGDFQTARLGAGDRGWTTRGTYEGRAGGAATYESPHIRYRDIVADAALTVALALAPAEEAPTLADLEAALDAPARPLFLGRKPCLPSRPLLSGDAARRFVEAPDPFAALLAAADDGIENHDEHVEGPLVVGPAFAEAPAAFARDFVADLRNWTSGVHGGGRRVARGRMTRLPGAGPRA